MMPTKSEYSKLCGEYAEDVRVLQAEKTAVDFVLVDRELTIDELQRVQRSQDMVIRDQEEELRDLNEEVTNLKSKVNLKNAVIENSQEVARGLMKDIEALTLSGRVTMPVEVVGRAEVRGMVKTIVRDELADMVDRLLEK